MISIEFLLTSLVVVLMPGTGVLYTVAIGLFVGKRASFFAALGCTLGILPALLASSFGLAAIFHTSTLAFQVVKYAGAMYLLYLAWQMWRASSPLSVNEAQAATKYRGLIMKGFLLNILNPKLSIFFLAFLPQFIPNVTQSVFMNMLALGSIFMLMTFVVFLFYGFLSGTFSAFIVKSEKASLAMQKFFASSFAALGIKLALSERLS
ncbi:LysE family translocator [Marinomonas aquiplantarum]|uniref:Threonine/homoserine/homoserine lactone efflux protein n=1 Tax=Marinomonas aquiplantarum TaxID=491951 RepID=A0A366D369_9GAMM|nr:LysE family translocator [Marinomonas aquiplantarum]RBO83959.1 threonine/homoserine/homoserine lactone efflux protein [Marinomonas aquiplantarum]